MSNHKSAEERDADIPGKRRSGAVLTVETVEALGYVQIYVAYKPDTTEGPPRSSNSRTISVVMENWLCEMGLLASEARYHKPEEYQALCDAAKKAAHLDGPIQKMS